MDHAWIKISKTWISVDHKKTWIKCGSKFFSTTSKRRVSSEKIFPLQFWNVDHAWIKYKRGSAWIKISVDQVWIKKLRCGSKIPWYSQLCASSRTINLKGLWFWLCRCFFVCLSQQGLVLISVHPPLTDCIQGECGQHGPFIVMGFFLDYVFR